MTKAIEKLDAKIASLEKRLEPLKERRRILREEEFRKKARRTVLQGYRAENGLEYHDFGYTDPIVAKPGELFRELVEITPRILRDRVIRIEGEKETIILEWCRQI